MNLPLVSICIPAYNAAPYIRETIDCWLNQTYKNIEIIIQDDCSTDETYNIALELSMNDHRLKVYKNVKNLGIGDNWNEAYKKAVGHYVVIFNADDTVEINFLEDSLAKFREFNEIDLVAHNFIRSFETDKEFVESNVFLGGLTQDLINIDKKQPKRISWNYTLVKKNSLDLLKNEYGLFYPTQVCDSMLWFEAYKRSLKGYYINKVVGVYRDHETNNSKIAFGEFESTYLWMVPIFPEIFNLIHPKSLYSTLKLLIGYLRRCLKTGHAINLKVVKNILYYRI